MRRIAFLCLALISCTTNSPRLTSMQLEVKLTEGVKSTCLIVTAKGARERSTPPVLINGRNTLLIGIAQEDEPDLATLSAIGFSDEACTMETTPIEGVKPIELSYGNAPKHTVYFEVIPQDVDMDTYAADVDCNDGQPEVHPGATERCDNLADDDCNDKTDCEETICANQRCHANGGLCVSGRCVETMCSDTRDDDGDLKADCADSDCDGRTCGTGGTCLDAGCIAPNEMGLCNDGIDNDGDGLADCADLTDCPPATSCTDGNACTTGETCSASNTCAGGTTTTCTNPPGVCFGANGTCNPGSGTCEYPVDTTNICSDFDSCTTDVCLGDGGCGSTPIACTTPPGGCFAGTGTCSNGACTYGVAAAGTACDDGSNCTINDACNGIDSACTGARPFCAPLTECQRPAQTCNDAGACDTTPWLGGCDAGLCNASGACVPLFTYVPSNFTTAQLPPSSGALSLDCDTTIETRSADGGIGWTSCKPRPTFTIITAGGVESVLVLFDSLGIDANRTFRAIGARPLIIAVATNAMINGTLDVSSRSDGLGAGAGIGCGTTGNGRDGGFAGELSSGGGGAGFRNDGTNASEGTGLTMRAGARGLANGTAEIVPIHGGCRGGNGGRSTGTGGGLGGGAVQLSVAQNLSIAGNAKVLAHGRGGLGGKSSTHTGGGGGGTGGSVLLEGTSFTLSGNAMVASNGGGGGEGAGLIANGNDGQDGQDSRDRANGGRLGACGGDGGEGGARNGVAGAADAPTPPAACLGASSSGGGGGGSAGRIRLNFSAGCTVSGNAFVSPIPSSAQSSCMN